MRIFASARSQSVRRTSLQNAQSRKQSLVAFAVAVALAAIPVSADAQELSPEEEMARKAQDPLGDVKALMTDNTIAFEAGPNEDDISYGFQLQPVYSMPKASYNMIARAVLPILGLEPGVVVPPIGGEPRPEDGSQWGLSDSLVQLFFSPKSDGAVKWGLGPQVSLKTQTSDRVAGPGWGGGLAGVIFGGSGNWAYGAIAMQHWGESFEILTLQPIVLYNFASRPGTYLGYNNSMTYDWRAKSDDAWTVPAGLTFGKTMLLASGNGLDLSVGIYSLAVWPQAAARWQLKLGVSYFFN